MRLLALSLLVAACSSPTIPDAPGAGGASVPAPVAPGGEDSIPPSPDMADGEPEPVVPHPDGVAAGPQLAGSDVPTMELDGCTVYTEPGETEAQAFVVHHTDGGETLTVDFMPYVRVLGAETCPAPGPDAYQAQAEGGGRVGQFVGFTARRYTTLFTFEYTQIGGVLSVFDGGDGAHITTASIWDGDLSPTVVAPHTLVFDRYHGGADELAIDCSPDPDGAPPFVVERMRLDLDTRAVTGDGLRCIQ